MRKFFYLLLFNFCFMSSAYSQYELVGSEDYGRFYNVIYDKTIENKLYALTMGNHIIYSEDNGENWDILYGAPLAQFAKTDHNLKTFQDDYLSFSAGTSPVTASRSVFVIHKMTGAFVKQYTAPIPDSNSNKYFVSAYSLSETDPNYAVISLNYFIGFAGFNSVYATQDGGTTWNIIYTNATSDLPFINLVEIDPVNPQKLYITRSVADENLGGLMISTDNGTNWEESFQGITLSNLEFHPENLNEVWLGTGIAVLDHPEGLYKSIDNGENWTLIDLPWTDYILDCITTIHFNPSNPSKIVVLEDNEIAISNDGGQTWDLTVYPDAYDVPENYSFGTTASFNPFNENQLVISSNYYPMMSHDGGETMEIIRSSYFHAEGSINLVETENEKNLYYSVQYGTAYKNLNNQEEGANNVMPLHFMTNGSGTSLFVEKRQPGRVFTYSGNFMGKNLKVSDEHGANPTQIHLSFLNNLHGIASFPTNINKIWASYSSQLEENEVYEIDFSDLNNITETLIPVPTTFGAVVGMKFDPENPQNVTIAKGSQIYKSTDGGNTWNDSNAGLTLNPNSDLIMKMVENPFHENQLSLATTNGIYTSFDNGINWTQLNTIFAHNMEHSDKNPEHLVAVTHDSDDTVFGLNISIDAGENWINIPPSDLLNIMSNHIYFSTDFDFQQDYVDMYVAATGLGVVKFKIDFTTLEVSEPEFITKDKTLLYPNPTKDTFTISTEKNIQKIDVYAMSGERLISHSSTSKTLNVSHLNPGVYIVKILFENGETVSEKLIRK
jgi:xyloglucan-specific exo-beta-1,4-glucanase